MQGIVLDNDVFVIEHTLPPHNDVFTAPAAFFHYEGWGVFKSKETLAAQLRIAAVLLRKTGRSRPLFASLAGTVLCHSWLKTISIFWGG